MMTDLTPVQFKFDKLREWKDFSKRCTRRLRSASKLNIKHLPQLEPHPGICAIVGAGPSVCTQLEAINAISFGTHNRIISINGAHNWLIESGTPPHIHVVFEDDLEDVTVALGGQPHPDVTYYVCSHCAPGIFKQLSDNARVLWHAFLPPHGYQRAVAKWFPGEFMVGGGHTTFFRALSIAIVLGYREIELFGVDSSIEESSHVAGYAVADKEQRVDIWGKDLRDGSVRKFTSQGGLVVQATQFLEFCTANQTDLRLRVHGDGLLRYVHESRYPEQYQTTKGL